MSELSEYEEKYELRSNITSEAVRMKFLKHNKLWLLHHLTSVLTPRSDNYHVCVWSEDNVWILDQSRETALT